MFPGFLLLFLIAVVLVVLLASVGLVYNMTHPERRTWAWALAHRRPTEPAELGMVGEERTFHFADGSTSPGWVLQGQDQDGPIVIVLHGWSSSRFSSLVRGSRVLPWASKAIAYDLRAHGDSSAMCCTMGAAERDDVAQLLEQVDDTDRGVVLYGSSFGAGLAIASAVQGPTKLRERIVGVIAEGAYRYPMEPVRRHLRMQRWPAEPVCSLAGLGLALLYGRKIRQFDRAKLASQLRVPLLVMHGDRDPISPYASAQAIAKSAPQGTLVTFPNGEHGGLADRDPERYRQALGAFFGEIKSIPRQARQERQDVETKQSRIADNQGPSDHQP
ncbi:MAG: alpha/beta fold hydrolase [Phycisphaera sp.]|nr:alpha/beta fold hydrolase [Phycisphaera sp.]